MPRGPQQGVNALEDPNKLQSSRALTEFGGVNALENSVNALEDPSELPAYGPPLRGVHSHFYALRDGGRGDNGIGVKANRNLKA
jgi:hypothetical protein